MATHVGQKLNGHFIEVKQPFVNHVMENFKNGGDYINVLLSMSVNMDEPALFFEARVRSTKHHTGARSISIRASGSSNGRMSACVSIACDGTKLPLFLLFKGKPDG